jgi:hypothetical protein
MYATTGIHIDKNVKHYFIINFTTPIFYFC